MLCRGPSGKIHVTPSARPLGWQEPQVLQALFDCLPRNCRGLMLRIGIPTSPLLGTPSAVKKTNLPLRAASSKLPRAGNLLVGMLRVMMVLLVKSRVDTERLTSLFTKA